MISYQRTYPGLLLVDRHTRLAYMLLAARDVYQEPLYRGVPAGADVEFLGGGAGDGNIYGPCIYFGWGDTGKRTALLFARNGGKLLTYRLRPGVRYITSKGIMNRMVELRKSPDYEPHLEQLVSDPSKAAKHFGYDVVFMSKPPYVIVQNASDVVRVRKTPAMSA